MRRITRRGPRGVAGVPGEARLQLRHPRLERGNLLVQPELLGLDLGEQALHERTNRWRRGGPIER